MKRFGVPSVIVTEGLQSYGAAMKDVGNAGCQETRRHSANLAEWRQPAPPEPASRDFRRRGRIPPATTAGAYPAGDTARLFAFAGPLIGV